MTTTSSDARSVNLLTADGVRLHGLYADSVGADDRSAPARLCFVICHGMTNATGKASSRAAIDAFARHGAVLAMDFRGHGLSGGRSSVGRTEVLDVDAAIGHARSLGHARIAVIGFSMGGAVTLRHAGLVEHDRQNSSLVEQGRQNSSLVEHGSQNSSLVEHDRQNSSLVEHDRQNSSLVEQGRQARVETPALLAELSEFNLQHQPDVVVSVSAPSRWFSRESIPMRRIQWLLEHPLGKLVAPKLGIRLGEPWATVPLTPLELVGRIEAPLLIVHGNLDHYFDPDRARELHRAAPQSEFWLIPTLAHAESSITGEIIDRIAAWVDSRLE